MTESSRQASIQDANNFRKEARQQDVGSRITTTGALRLNAGNDITATAANLSSDQAQIDLTAGNNITLDVGRATLDFEEGLKIKSSGFLSSTTRTRRDTIKADNAVGSVLSGNRVNLNAGNDINVTGSDAVATQGLTLNAQNNVNITAATDIRLELNLREKKKSGLFSSGGLGVTLGTQQLNKDTTTQVASAAGSTLGSIDGNATFNAGKDFNQIGSTVSAPQGDVSITAQNIAIAAAQTTSKTIQETRFKQSGISVSITNPVVSAVQTTQRLAAAASDTKDGRLKALAAATVGLSAYNALDAIQQGKTIENANTADKLGGINLSISLGSAKSKTTTTQTQTDAVSSVVAAGNNIALNATGTPDKRVNDEDDLPEIPVAPNTGGDINIIGSELRAGNNVTLIANNAINLTAAQNTRTLERDSQGSNASIGIGFSLGAKTGISVNASVSKNKGSAEGDDTTNTLSRVDASNLAELASGENTTLKGAVVKGEQIIANVGGDLNIESTQDTSTFTSKNRSGGASVSVPLYGAGNFSASLNANKSDIDSEFTSVIEQSGFKAGSDGFDVTVQGNTDLKGAVIASNQTAIQANKNQLTTGTLTTSNLDNTAEFEADAVGISAGISINPGKQGFINGKAQPLAGGGVGQDSGRSSSTTLSGISSGRITITDDEKQQALTGQDANLTVASLNRNVDSDKDTSNALARIFDEQTVQREIDAQVLIAQEFGKVAPKAVAAFSSERASALRIEAAKVEERDPIRAAELRAQAKQYDEGGEIRSALHIIIGGLTGGIEGAAGAGAVALSANLLSDLQKAVQKRLIEIGTSADAASLVSQGLAQLTALGVGGAVGGTDGAAIALAVDANNRQLHQGDVDKAKQVIALFKKTVESREGVISDEEAEGRLIRTLLRLADLETDRADGFRVDEAALSFLGANFIDVTESERRDPRINQDVLLSNVDLFTNAALQDNRGLTPEERDARNDRAGAPVAKTLAVLYAALAGTPAIVNGVRTCFANPYLCFNKLGITASEAALPEGLALTGAGALAVKKGLKDTGKVGFTSIGAGRNTSKSFDTGGPTTSRPIFSLKATLEHKATSGVKLVSTPNKTTTILGNFRSDTSKILSELNYPKTLNFSKKNGGYNLLNVPDKFNKSPSQFFNDFNKPFLDRAIERGDIIVLSTKPTKRTLNRLLPDGSITRSGFGREFDYLISKGYRYDAQSSVLIRP